MILIQRVIQQWRSQLNIFTLLVNGGWSGWYTQSRCSVTCGRGVITYIRACNDPTPAYGGHNCHGPSTKHEYCRSQPCPGNIIYLKHCYNYQPKLISYYYIDMSRVKKIEVTVYGPFFDQPESLDWNHIIDIFDQIKYVWYLLSSAYEW